MLYVITIRRADGTFKRQFYSESISVVITETIKYMVSEELITHYVHITDRVCADMKILEEGNV